MSFINNPDIIDDGKGSVTIKGQRSDNDQVQFGSHLSSIYLMMQLGSASSDNTMQFYTNGSNEEGTDGVIRCNNVAAGITFPVKITDRARLENVSGDNQIATLEDLAVNTPPDIYDDGNGTVSIQKPDGSAANLNVTGSVTVSAVTNLNGKTTINSQVDNLPLQISGLGGQFWFYSSDEQNNGAVLRGGTQNNYGMVFTGTDRVRIEGVSGDNRAAVIRDLSQTKAYSSGIWAINGVSVSGTFPTSKMILSGMAITTIGTGAYTISIDLASIGFMNNAASVLCTGSASLDAASEVSALVEILPNTTILKIRGNNLSGYSVNAEFGFSIVVL